MNSILRIIKFSLQDFGRNIWLSLVTITIITSALFSINLLISINIITDNAAKAIQEKIDVSIFFKPSVERSDIAKTKSFLDSLPEVQSTIIIPKEEGLEKIKDLPVVKDSLAELSENPLNDALRIKAKDINDYPRIMGYLEAPEYDILIEESDKNFEQGQVYIQRIGDLSYRIKQIVMVITAVFVLISLLIVYNTIRITIYAHRGEITIMKLVGAGNWFVRAPFLLSGFLFAIISLALTVVLFYFALDAAQPYLAQLFGEYPFDLMFYFRQNFLMIFGLELGLMTLLNMISSSLALGKYLKV